MGLRLSKGAYIGSGGLDLDLETPEDKLTPKVRMQNARNEREDGNRGEEWSFDKEDRASK